MNDFAIKLEDVCFAYKNKVVLENINLSVKYGDYLAILGANGGGKTTLLKIILGLLKPIKGKVSIMGQEPKKGLKFLGYVPQESTINKGFPLTVIDAVLMGLKSKKKFGLRYDKEDIKLASEVLDKVDMAAYKKRKMDELSGGERKRVYLARSLVSKPKILLLDEPTSSVDPHGTFCFLRFLEELSANVTILIVSHDLSIVSSKISSLACINKYLYYNAKAEMTPEMFSLILGTHNEHICSFGEYVKEKSQHLTNIRARQH